MAHVQDVSPTFVESDLTGYEYQRSAVVSRQIKKILPNLEDSGIAKKVSSETFHYLVQKNAWGFLLKDQPHPPPFPYPPPPKKYGPPYSRVLLALCTLADSENAAEEKLAEGYKGELPRRTPEDTFDEAVLKSIWDRVLPGCPYEKHCGPFQWTLPSDVALPRYVGGDMEDLLHTMNSIASMMSPDLVLVCARGDLRDVYPDVPCEEARLVRFELGPTKHARVESPGFLTRILQAWTDLFQIHLDLLAGDEFSMVNSLRGMYRKQLMQMTRAQVEKRQEGEANRGRRVLMKIDESFNNSQIDDPEVLAKMLTVQHRAVMKEAREAAAVVLAGCPADWQARRNRLDAFVTGKKDGELACLKWKDLAMLVLPYSKALGMELLLRKLDVLREHLCTFDNFRDFVEDFVLRDVNDAFKMSGLLDQHTRLEMVMESFAKLPHKYYEEEYVDEWLYGIWERIETEEQDWLTDTLTLPRHKP
ncbi:hypothetical protein F4775DRAFT_591683 [Biscogniauxia sp. FL1348]|nr:hypothetical protein F4775DRAFT_591683 [Biscogniauxia sp. FL1348]